MNRFKRILAVYDDAPGGDDVLLQAVALARANAARLTIVNPLDAPRSPGVVDEARRRLRRILPWIAQEGVADASTEVLVGTPHVEIVRRVEEDAHDLVIVNADGARTFKDVIVGNTATNLMLKCPSAVWLLKPGQSMPCNNIVAAIDPPMGGPCSGDLGEKILGLATSVAQSDAARLHVVHFWDVDGSEGEALQSELPRDTRRKILEKHEGLRRRALSDLLSRHAGSHVVHEMHLPQGQPELRMAGIAAELSADLIVMGADCRVGLSRLLMGNFVETVLNGVRCSVLAVRPETMTPPTTQPRPTARRTGVPAEVH